jgi:hypothetical protein
MKNYNNLYQTINEIMSATSADISSGKKNIQSPSHMGFKTPGVNTTWQQRGEQGQNRRRQELNNLVKKLGVDVLGNTESPSHGEHRSDGGPGGGWNLPPWARPPRWLPWGVDPWGPSKPEPKPDPEKEPKPEPEKEPEPEPKPEPEKEPKPEPKPDPGPDIETPWNPYTVDPERPVLPVPKPKPEPEPKPDEPVSPDIFDPNEPWLTPITPTLPEPIYPWPRPDAPITIPQPPKIKPPPVPFNPYFIPPPLINPGWRPTRGPWKPGRLNPFRRPALPRK